MLKYFEKVIRKYKNAKEIWNNLFIIEKIFKNLRQLCKTNIRKFLLSSQ